jgi:hypothetical protein
MHERVTAALVGSDETESLGLVEEFYSANGHITFLRLKNRTSVLQLVEAREGSGAAKRLRPSIATGSDASIGQNPRH